MDGPQHMLLVAYSESDRRGSSGSLVVVVTVVVTFFHDDVSPQRSFYWAGFIFPGLTSLGGWASACAVAVYSESDRRGSSGSLVVVVVVTFFHDDVSQRSFYWAGFIFPGLKSLGGWASACAVGGVFRVGLEGFEWFFVVVVVTVVVTVVEVVVVVTVVVVTFFHKIFGFFSQVGERSRDSDGRRGQGHSVSTNTRINI